MIDISIRPALLILHLHHTLPLNQLIIITMTGQPITATKFWMHFTNYVSKEDIAYVRTTKARNEHANTDWCTSIQSKGDKILRKARL